MDDLVPIRTTDRMTDAVHRTLQEAILTGGLAPGTKLSVPALAARLEVSRSPVREAVMRLTQERLARETPRHGAVVNEVGVEELAELYVVREVLEGVAARLAVERGGAGALVGELEEVLAAHRRAVDEGDQQGHTEADLRFHVAIRRAGGNAHVERALDDLQNQVRLGMVTTSVTGGPRAALEEHEAILAAIRDGDADAAEARSRAHIVRLRRVLGARAAQPAEGSA